MKRQLWITLNINIKMTRATETRIGEVKEAPDFSRG